MLPGLKLEMPRGLPAGWGLGACEVASTRRFLPQLVVSLNNLSNALCDLGAARIEGVLVGA